MCSLKEASAQNLRRQLHLGCNHGLADVVQESLRLLRDRHFSVRGEVLRIVDIRHPGHDSTPLHEAVRFDREEIVQLLLSEARDSGEDMAALVNSKGSETFFDKTYSHPLISTTRRSVRSRMMSALLDAGAIQTDGVALCKAVEAYTEHIALKWKMSENNQMEDWEGTRAELRTKVQLLLERRYMSDEDLRAFLFRICSTTPELHSEERALWFVAPRASLSIVALGLQILRHRQSNRGEVMRIVDIRDGDGNTLLHGAADSGQKRLMDTLLRDARENNEDVRTLVNSQNANGDTPLHKAMMVGTGAVRGHPAEVKMISSLLDAGADVLAQNRLGNTALHEAVCSEENSAQISLLLGRGGQELRIKKNQNGLSAIAESERLARERACSKW